VFYELVFMIYKYMYYEFTLRTKLPMVGLLLRHFIYIYVCLEKFRSLNNLTQLDT